MKFKEFEQGILKNEIETRKDLYNYGNFFVRYYCSRTQLWVAIVAAKNNEVIGCSIASNLENGRFAQTINKPPIKPFSVIIEKHTDTILGKRQAIPIHAPAVDYFAKGAAKEMLEELKIFEVPKVISRLKRVTPTEQFALPDTKLTEKVAVQRAKVLCPNCEEEYLHFKGKLEGKAIITCKHCRISYYKKL